MEAKDERVLLFKVNRREPKQESLFPLPDHFHHVASAMKFGPTTTTGRKDKRTWRLGNRVVDHREQLLSGQIGWETSKVQATGSYDEDRLEWIETEQLARQGPYAPFVYDGRTQLLGVIRDRSFPVRALSAVFRDFLQLGELTLSTSAEVDWDVEPIMDQEGFNEWLRQTTVVEKIVLVSRIPNPDGLEAFEEKFARLDRLGAKQITEEIIAADPDRGLEHLNQDSDVRESVAMASFGYGYIRAVGRSGDRPRHYDQRDRAATELLPAKPDEDRSPGRRLRDLMLHLRRSRSK